MVAVEAHVADAGRGHELEHAVEDAEARAQDGDEHDLLALQGGGLDLGERGLDLDVRELHVPGGLVGQQRGQLGHRPAEHR